MFSIKNSTFWLKSIILVLILAMLYYTIQKNEYLNKDYLLLLSEAWQKNARYFIVALVLIPLNISLEAVKWQYLIGKIEKINFKKALEGVLAGITLGFATPHGIGDYAARILTLMHEERMKGIGTVFICRISQFYITLYFGTAALLVFFAMFISLEEKSSMLTLISVSILASIVFGVVYYAHKRILSVLESKAYLKKIIPYIEIIRQYSFKELNRVVFLSFLRYVVFSTQFILLLLFFDVSLSLLWMAVGVAFVFLIKSIIPTFLDLGIREAAAVIFFSHFSLEQMDVLMASLTLWLCNIIFPALIGLVMVLKLNIFKQKQLISKNN